MSFVNRNSELIRLKQALENKSARLIVLYGRRRCGKSTLIKEVLKKSDFYYMADQSDETVQRIHLANVIGEKINGFEDVIYPDWDSLFRNLNNSLKEFTTICLDEFPYLVKNSPELPSIIQRIIDSERDRKYHLVLCGSSQQMMQGIVLDSNSSLYGRAHEILNIQPMEAGWLKEYIKLPADQVVREYSVWGGVPRYWELRLQHETFDIAVKQNVLDRLGILHEEPKRLFLDDMRESVQSYSIMTVVGNGCHRLSEIAARLNKPATQLSRPIDKLIQLGYLKREIPFVESVKSGKKSLYRISDPFMNFYFTFVVPNLSRLELGLTENVFNSIKPKLDQFVSLEWESLCRQSVPKHAIGGIEFDQAFSWWGAGLNGNKFELDVVAESLDKKHLLVGECKWAPVSDPQKLVESISRKANELPFAKNRSIVPILFAKSFRKSTLQSILLTPNQVLVRLKQI